MTPSSWVYEYLKSIEQLRVTAYLPTPDDVWTIGWGHTHGVREGDTCAVAQAMEWLEEDLADTAAAVNRLVTAPLTQCQFDALMSLVYNIGEGNFATSTLLRLLNAEDYTGAADQFLRWNHQHGVVLAGLTARRAHERERFLTV